MKLPAWIITIALIAAMVVVISSCVTRLEISKRGETEADRAAQALVVVGEIDRQCRDLHNAVLREEGKEILKVGDKTPKCSLSISASSADGNTEITSP